MIRIELDEELGGEPLVAGAKLVAIDYDPPGKGNAFTISFSPDEAHIILLMFDIIRKVRGWDIDGPGAKKNEQKD